MTCKRFHNWIKDAAVNSLDAGRTAKLTAHLTHCAGCRDFFAEEERLVGAIDRGLTESLSREASPDFAARVRIRLAEEVERSPLRTPWAFSGWVPACAVGVPVLFVLIIAIWFLNRPAPPRVAFVTPASPLEHLTPPAKQAKQAHPPVTSLAPGRGSRRVRTTTLSNELQETRRQRQAPDTQVLAQPGQWAAIAQLSRTMQAGGAFRSLPLGEIAEQEQPIAIKPFAINPIEIEPIEIEPIEIEPIEVESVEIEPVKIKNITIAEIF